MDKFFGITGNILLAVLFILLLLIFLVVLVCISHPKIIIRYKEKPEISASLWFIRFNITRFMSRPKKNKEPKVLHFDGTNFGEMPKDTKKDKKKKKNDGKQIKKSVSATQKKDKKPLAESISEITELVTDILSDIKEPLKKVLTVHIKRLYITTASEDAHKTALLFGHANTAAGSLIYTCRKFASLSIDEENVGVYSDFNGTKSELDTHIVLTLSCKHVISCAFKGLMKFINRKA